MKSLNKTTHNQIIVPIEYTKCDTFTNLPFTRILNMQLPISMKSIDRHNKIYIALG